MSFKRKVATAPMLAGAILTALFWHMSIKAAQPPTVAVSIKPLHSLVQAVMDGVGSAQLVVEQGSPHLYRLRPSAVRLLDNADIVVWNGPGTERFLSRIIDGLAGEATIIETAALPGMHLLPLREALASLGPTRSTDPTAAALAHTHNTDSGHAQAESDPHVWLDTNNARTIVQAISRALIRIDGDNRVTYQQNTAAVMGRLDALDANMSSQLAPLSAKPFIVFHDSFQYLEQRYQLQGLGALSFQPDTQPGAATIKKVSALLAENKIVCLFSEPQFPSNLVTMLITQNAVRHAQLDPLGASLPPGSSLYFLMMQSNTESIRGCLQDSH